MGERRGTKALELWCRRITEGYPGVNVQNMTTSWKDGLAFCAMIHHFRPDLIDFDSLDKNNVYENNELAFKIAEQHLGIPALLDAEDMASCSVPDRLSILTYLSQFYQTFGGASPSRLAVNRSTESTDETITSLPESPKEKASLGTGMRRDPCAVCGLPVFLAEKLVLARVAYHRTCFRCARCNNQLTLGNYYETEEGQYCCETCPDEEPPSPTMTSYSETTLPSKNGTDGVVQDFGYNGFFNDENKANTSTFDDCSAKKLELDDSLVPDIVAQTSRLRLNFISSHLLSDQDAADGIDSKISVNDEYEKERVSAPMRVESQLVEDEETNEKLSSVQLESQSSSNESPYGDEGSSEGTSESSATKYSIREELGNNNKLTPSSSNDIIEDKVVASTTKITAKKPLIDDTQDHEDGEKCLSLVQARLKLFENAKDYNGRKKNQTVEVLKPKAQYREYNATRKSPTEKTINSDATRSEEPDTKLHVSEQNVADLDNTLDSASLNNLTPSRISGTISSQEKALDDNTENSNTKQIEHDEILNSKNEFKQEESKEDQASASETDSMIRVSPVAKVDYPENLNPFKSDEEDDVDARSTTSKPSQASTNPFDDDGTKAEIQKKKTDEVPAIPKPAARKNIDNNTIKSESYTEVSTKRRLIAPQINLNPFWSDEDDQESDTECRGKTPEAKPVPKPRSTRSIQEFGISPPRLNESHNSLNASNTSLTSLDSGTNLGVPSRKKKPAPLPPNQKERLLPDSRMPLTSSPNVIPKARKIKPAPPPPIQTSSPYNTSTDTVLSCEESPLNKSRDSSKRLNLWEDEKINKDEANRNRQSFTHTPGKEGFHDRSFVDKSTEGKWKRKKGPAPPCPMPLKRKIKVMSLKDVKLELDEIEMQQQGLERQGVRLEQLIRSKCESESRPDVSLGTDVEELVLELFALVNEKNELFRRQAELMLLRRQQRLEEEHAEVEYQIRCLMSQQESMKTDFDKQREELLIKRLVEIVERRNEIVDCLEMDRRREIEEDKSIHKHMDLFAAKNKNETSNKCSNHIRKSKLKEGKSKDKSKEKKLRKMVKKDIDKDIDEIELKLKRHNKRKWF